MSCAPELCTMGTDTEAHRLIAEHRRIWEQKPALRRIYKEEFFSRLLSFCQRGHVSVEVGAGPGFLKEMLPDLISRMWSSALGWMPLLTHNTCLSRPPASRILWDWMFCIILRRP